MMRKARPEPSPAGAGGKLGDHRGDQGQAAGDAEAGQEEGEGGGKLEVVGGSASAMCAIEFEEVEEIVILSNSGPSWRVREDREEGDEEGADREGPPVCRGVDQDQGRDRHDRRHLQDDRIVGNEGGFDPARLRDAASASATPVTSAITSDPEGVLSVIGVLC